MNQWRSWDITLCSECLEYFHIIYYMSVKRRGTDKFPFRKIPAYQSKRIALVKWDREQEEVITMLDNDFKM